MKEERKLGLEPTRGSVYNAHSEELAPYIPKKSFGLSSIAFGNQTISRQNDLEIHGFASSLHSEFAIYRMQSLKRTVQ